MAYVNEYASDEDIEKYKLNEVWDRYHPHEKDDRFWGRKPELTIDHDRDVFLMVVSQRQSIRRYAVQVFVVDWW